MFTKLGRTAIICVSLMLSTAAFPQETQRLELVVMKERFADMKADVSARDRESGWKYSMEAEYALLAIDRALQALEQAEREPTEATSGKLREQYQRVNAAYERFVNLVENRPTLWLIDP